MDTTKDSFAADDKNVDAMVCNLTVIGEAAKYVPEKVKQSHPELPWKEMAGIRDVVVHHYFRVSLDIVWENIQNDLRPLVPLLKVVLSEPDD